MSGGVSLTGNVRSAAADTCRRLPLKVRPLVVRARVPRGFLQAVCLRASTLLSNRNHVGSIRLLQVSVKCAHLVL